MSDKRTMIGIIAAVIIIPALGIYFLNGAFTFSPDQKNNSSRKEYGPIGPFYPTLGVMLENELLSRPFQKGLSGADVVYEAPAEGGITRFLALFNGESYPAKMGPIRSARTYYLDWLHEYPNALYAHVGGNPDVLARLPKESVRNVDQFLDGQYFRREHVGETALEHTMFSTKEFMQTLVSAKKWLMEKPAEPMSHFANGTPVTENLGVSATHIVIDFSTSTYKVSYAYDLSSDSFLRSQAGKPHIDHGNNKPLSAKTVIVQEVVSHDNGDREGSISIDTLAGGKAMVFAGGKAFPATWQKESLTSPTRFFAANGANDKELSFAGPVWIEVLPAPHTFTHE